MLEKLRETRGKQNMKPQLCQTSLLCSSICSGVNAFCFDATSVSTSTCWTTTAAISTLFMATMFAVVFFSF